MSTADPAGKPDTVDPMGHSMDAAVGHASLVRTLELAPGEPLWKRAPTRDDTGQLLSDFMMLIPKLGSRPDAQIRSTIAEIDAVLTLYRKFVVFADLNLRLNVLWVSVRPRPGICLELPAAIHHRVPEAMLIGQKLTP